MKKKYFNEAIIGNENITASFSSQGELLRLYYPTSDFRQFVDYFHAGVKINDSALIYLHDDINNVYRQEYIKNTNILKTIIENTYFGLEVEQLDYVLLEENVLVKKYTIKNKNSIYLDVNFLVHSKLLTTYNNMVGAKIENDNLLQYSHDYTYAIFSKDEIGSYQLNNSEEVIKSGVIRDKDHIGMAPDASVCYKLEEIAPGEEREVYIMIYINDNRVQSSMSEVVNYIDELKNINYDKEYEEVKKYWERYVKDHSRLKLTSLNKNNADKYEKIYNRTILLYPLLMDEQTGGISASLEVDEDKDNSGRYAYCWTRDAVFITSALDLLNMEKETEKFYNVFCKMTQSLNGMWEQRFFTDGNLAPCWGYQIDETASVIIGVYSHYDHTASIPFLKDTYSMCKRGINYLKLYLRNIFSQDDSHLYDYHILDGDEHIQVSYDLWEMHEGVHLYSLSAIYSAMKKMREITEILIPLYKRDKKKQVYMEEEIEELDNYAKNIKIYIENNLRNPVKKCFKRNLKDNVVDISLLGSIVPFDVFDTDDVYVQNTIEEINLTLKTYTDGYLRFENDNYMGGKNPWPIATLWMALYYIKIGDRDEALKCLDFVANTASHHGLLAEQVDNQELKPNWVFGLGWSHAMFILVLEELSSKGKKSK